MCVKTIRVCSDTQGNRWGTIWYQGHWYVVDKLPPELLVKIAMDRLKKKTKTEG